MKEPFPAKFLAQDGVRRIHPGHDGRFSRQPKRGGQTSRGSAQRLPSAAPASGARRLPGPGQGGLANDGVAPALIEPAAVALVPHRGRSARCADMMTHHAVETDDSALAVCAQPESEIDILAAVFEGLLKPAEV